MAQITAKVRCNARKPWGEDQAIVEFGPDYYDDQGREVNKSWALYTPGIGITMTVRAEVPFEPGKSYTLTFDDGL